MSTSTITTKTVIYKGYPVYIILKEGKENGFLMPFRKYRFQVCGNLNGECDMGSSQVDPRMQNPAFVKDVGESYIRGHVNEALVRFSNTSYGGNVIDNMHDFYAITNENYDNELNKFIHAGYLYLAGDSNYLSGIPEYVEEKENHYEKNHQYI